MRSGVDLLLVNPGNRAECYGNLGPGLAGIEPPLWCALIASFIREKGFSVGIIDADALNLTPLQTAERISAADPLLAGIVVLGTNPSASSTPKMTAVSQVLKALKDKAPGVKTVLSGLHPSALPERTLSEETVDFICRGEGFYAFLELLKDLKSGKNPVDSKIPGLGFRREGVLTLNGYSEVINDLGEIPMAAWDLLPMDKYRAHNWHCFDNLAGRSPYAVVYTSLGCPFSCSYCPIQSFYSKPGIRFRGPGSVADEIDSLVRKYNVRNIKILDELFVINEARVFEICDLIIHLGHKLNIWVYARVDTVTAAILNKMKQAGINWVSFGIESANTGVRQGVSKKISQDKINEAVAMAKGAGINIMGNFIFGLPDDNSETMNETLGLAKRLNCEYVNFYVAMAYPGSRLYAEALKNNTRLPDKWHGYGQYSYSAVPMPTKYLSAKEVLRFRDEAFVDYFSDPGYLSMINQKFGAGVLAHIKDMLKNKIRRELLDEREQAG